uniref:Uncharacterized protein n=1 Tax=Glossina pallidipes TaxID=7398 RepID=A0A1A9ZI19_GLOPL
MAASSHKKFSELELHETCFIFRIETALPKAITPRYSEEHDLCLPMIMITAVDNASAWSSAVVKDVFRWILAHSASDVQCIEYHMLRSAYCPSVVLAYRGNLLISEADLGRHLRDVCG